MSVMGLIGGIVIAVIFKFVFKNMLIDSLANALSGGEGGNKLIAGVVHFLMPGLIALILLIIASYLTPICPQAAMFLVVIAIITGGILGLGFVNFSAMLPFIGDFIGPLVGPILPIFWILLIVAIVEFILSLVMPPAGMIMSIVAPIVIIIILGAAAGNVFEITTCVVQASKSGALIEWQKNLLGGIWIGTGVPK